jgi:quercetin dioxygenase-like cupin family protein
MKVAHCEKIEAAPVDMDGAVGCKMRCLIGPDDGAPRFTMRLFEVGSGGHTPKHRHPHEHEVFVLEGIGSVLEGDREHPLRAGVCVFVPPNELHQFRNTGVGPLKFLCLIPNSLPEATGSCPTTCDCG